MSAFTLTLSAASSAAGGATFDEDPIVHTGQKPLCFTDYSFEERIINESLPVLEESPIKEIAIYSCPGNKNIPNKKFCYFATQGNPTTHENPFTFFGICKGIGEFAARFSSLAARKIPQTIQENLQASPPKESAGKSLNQSINSLVEESCMQIDQRFCREEPDVSLSGTAAGGICIIQNKKICAFNIGDIAVTSFLKTNTELMARDQKEQIFLNDEEILRVKGTDNPIFEIDGSTLHKKSHPCQLQTHIINGVKSNSTRALGCNQAKTALIGKPNAASYSIYGSFYRTHYAIIACPEIFNYFSIQNVTDIIAAGFESGSSLQEITKNIAEINIAKEKESIRREDIARGFDAPEPEDIKTEGRTIIIALFKAPAEAMPEDPAS